MSSFGWLDCLCDNNTCYACKWIDDYYERNPQLGAHRVYRHDGSYQWKIPSKITTITRPPQAKPFVPKPFVPIYDSRMRAVPARKP